MHNIGYYWHQSSPEGFLHIILYNQTRGNKFIRFILLLKFDTISIIIINIYF